MHQQEFNELPLLLSRSKFLAATGLSDRALTKLVEDGVIRTFIRGRKSGAPRRKQDVRRLYPKSEAAKITGLSL